MDTVHPEFITIPPLGPKPEVDSDGSRAAPFLLYGAERKPELITRQNRLLYELAVIAMREIRRYTTEEVAIYAAERIVMRMLQVEGMNSSIYNYNRLNADPDLTVGGPDVTPEMVREACEAAAYGGEVLQNDLARQAFGMASIGYSELTIIGDQRREYEAPMLANVGKLTNTDPTPRLEQMTNLRVLGFHQYDKRSMAPEAFGALRIGMKRTIATLDDGTEVKHRTVALINTRPSYGFQRDDLEEIIRSAVRRDNRGKLEHIQNADMSQNPAFMRVLRWLIESELQPGTVLTRNESVYGTNPIVQALVAARPNHHTFTLRRAA